jgi:hypothetical protein
MNRSALLMCSLVLAGVGSAAQASATLTRVSGGVRVNQGVEFVEAFEELALRPGDRIMTLENGRARITFDDGCDLDAGPNTMVTIPETSTCAGGQALTQNIAPGSTEAVGAGQSFNWRRALLIALPVAAGVAIYEHNRDDDATVSP